MDLKNINNIDKNIISSTVSFDSFGSEQLSSLEEKELINNFPISLTYRNLKFKKNIKIEGSVPVITDEENDDENIITVTLPPLSNQELFIDENFSATYKIDYTKIPNSLLTVNKVLKTKSLIAQAYCLIFSTVICETVKKLLDEIRAKAPGFEGEKIVSV